MDGRMPIFTITLFMQKISHLILQVLGLLEDIFILPSK